MKRNRYIRPELVCYELGFGQALLSGSTMEAEVYDDEFDPEGMVSLSRKGSLWDADDEDSYE